MSINRSVLDLLLKLLANKLSKSREKFKDFRRWNYDCPSHQDDFMIDCSSSERFEHQIRKSVALFTFANLLGY
ncbi:hypothetical protein OUZ56_014973 [Daphnia magna]|uniref:Uncharacterized protein n=1 Tax=Daphnia magna TaxID=35525 RepID=A0ABR0ALF5_9CRUS|nr:hypothetical protein OUZ56_014973 [Daphnia magna]